MAVISRIMAIIRTIFNCYGTLLSFVSLVFLFVAFFKCYKKKTQ